MLEKLLGSWSFSIIVSHFAHHQVTLPTFLGVRPSFNGSTYYPHLLRMLSFDRSYISFSFLARGAPYFSWCGGTCKDRYLSFPSDTMKFPCNVTWGCLITCLAFRNFNGAILFSNAVFFDGPTTWIKIYFVYIYLTDKLEDWITHKPLLND
jgi:hypothetical protein